MFCVLRVSVGDHESFFLELFWQRRLCVISVMLYVLKPVVLFALRLLARRLKCCTL